MVILPVAEASLQRRGRGLQIGGTAITKY